MNEKREDFLRKTDTITPNPQGLTEDKHKLVFPVGFPGRRCTCFPFVLVFPLSLLDFLLKVCAGGGSSIDDQVIDNI